MFYDVPIMSSSSPTSTPDIASLSISSQLQQRSHDGYDTLPTARQPAYFSTSPAPHLQQQQAFQNGSLSAATMGIGGKPSRGGLPSVRSVSDWPPSLISFLSLSPPASPLFHKSLDSTGSNSSSNSSERPRIIAPSPRQPYLISPPVAAHHRSTIWAAWAAT